MTHLIDKAALVAEIERRKLYHIDLTEYNSGYKNAIFDILSLIDTLEVKEVDLEKEIAEQYESNFEEYLTYEEFANIAKYFFELGVKINKGELIWQKRMN